MSARWCLQAYLIYHCHKCVEVAYIGQDSLTVKVVARKRETVHSFIGNVLRVVLQPDDVEKEKIIAFQPNPACQSDDDNNNEKGAVLVRQAITSCISTIIISEHH